MLIFMYLSREAGALVCFVSCRKLVEREMLPEKDVKIQLY